ncbi:ABC transporter permease [Reyranella sp.]|uniref:ABC transporter permease n=1 Tax=Reyranella sp. TaxID=1929291 RepID=UPI003BAA6DD0
MRRLLLSLALQNLGRRRGRSLLLIAAVALGSGVVFTGAVLMRSIDRSMELGFARLGADLMVVPEGALTNITAALLVVEPTDLALDAGLLDKAGLASIGRVAPQKVVRMEHSGVGSQHDSVDLIGFEPAHDFTVQPWLAERLNRPLATGDVILGSGRAGALGSQFLIFGKPHTVYGRLARTGVGTHERGVFMSFATLDELAEICRREKPAPVLSPGKVTGFLVELAPGATALQARFAILSSVQGVKVVTGDTTLSGIRQGLAALLDGILALMAAMFASSALLVSVLFSAIVTERRGELGLLKAIGARRGQVLGMIVGEAVLATGIGGLLGVVLGVLAMRLFERSLVFYLETVGVPFVWVGASLLAAFAAATVVLACAIGAAGVLYPAWRASRRDAYELVRGGA